MFSSSHLTAFLVQSAFGDFNFDAVGDWGCNSNTGSTVNNIKAKNAERVLALGDYSYQPTATCWLNAIKDIRSITRINIGNHEYDGNGPSQYLNAFGNPNPPLTKQYYSFNYANAHVLTMATELSYSKGSAQYNFVLNDLKTAAANTNIKFIIVNFHKLMYTSPNTCSASSCAGSSSLRDIYHPLFDLYHVNIVFQAHVHNYQRTFPLKYDTVSPSTPTRTSTNPSTYTNPTGEIFATVGTGGINFHGFSGSQPYFVVKQQAQKFGVFDLSLSNDGTKLTGRYYRNGESSAFDTFTITKTATASSLGLSATNNANMTNQTSPPRITSNETVGNNQTAENKASDLIKDRKNIILPDLSELINRTKNNINLKSSDQKKQALTAKDNKTSLPVPNVETTDRHAEKPITRNILPSADAGTNKISIEGSQVTLDGSASKDKDGKIKSYLWQQISGPKVNLENANNLVALFKASSVTHDSILVFKLTITDDKGGKDSAITSVKVRNEKQTSSSLPNTLNLPTSNPEQTGITRNGNLTNSTIQ